MPVFRLGWMFAVVMCAFAFAGDVRAEGAGAWEQNCWEVPPPATMTEVWRRWDNAATPAEAPRGAVLAMSAGDLDAAYSAGVLTGWSDAGKRPQFSVVTGVGVSALIAPFAFIGPSADASVSDIFNCASANLKDMAEKAAARLDADALAVIGREHRSGRRLIVAAPETQSHPSVIWDIGKIAASGHPQAHDYVRRILLAAVDPSASVAPKDIPIAAGAIAASDRSLGLTGSGQGFLIPPAPAAAGSSKPRYYLINNGRIYPAESGAYMASIGNGASAKQASASTFLLEPAYSVFKRARRQSEEFLLTWIDCKLPLAPAANFDAAYLKALFLQGYRQGRTQQAWETSLPGEAWTTTVVR